MTICLKLEIVVGIFQNGNIAFCNDVKTRTFSCSACARPVVFKLAWRH